MAGSKTSHTMRNIVVGLLAIWSIISLIIIVVWATSPDLKGASECNAKLKDLKEKFAEEKKVWDMDRKALEELARQGYTNQSLLLIRIDQLKNTLQSLNQSLDSCMRQNVSVSGYCFLTCENYGLNDGHSSRLSCPWGCLEV